MPEFTSLNPLLPIIVSGLRLVRGERALLNSIDLNIAQSGITVIMGPNGAGKSLFLRCLHGLIEPDQGSILLGQRSVVDSRPDQAMVFQRPVLMRRTVLQNLAFAVPELAKANPEALDHALEQVNLLKQADQPARMLSGGEQQRLALARALLRQPKLLLLDEATASLDPASILMIESLVKRQSEQGTKVILISHDLGQARRLAHEVLFIHQGRVVEHRPADLFFSAPETEAARAYLAGEIVV